MVAAEPQFIYKVQKDLCAAIKFWDMVVLGKLIVDLRVFYKKAGLETIRP